MKRLAIIFNRIGPYHFARVRAAAGVMETILIEVFKSDDIYKWDLVPGTDGFQRLTLFENNSRTMDEVGRAIKDALDNCRPDAVAIPGWSDAVAFSAIQWCVANQVPSIVMSETTAWDERRSVWKEWIKGRIIKMFSAGLVGGKPHAEYLAKLGMASEQVVSGYDAVDNNYFLEKSKEARLKSSELGSKLALPKNYFLASARFVEKKNLFNLVQAYALYRDLAQKEKRPASEIWDLVLLGDGHLKPKLCELIADLALQKHIILPGFKQYAELPVYYALAKTFIHASTIEQWGLVVNEAMASGLPVLVSNRCGCAQDLVQEGINGFTFSPDNAAQLAQLMLKISDTRFPLSDLGAASTAIISHHGTQQFALGMKQAADCALAVRPRGASALDKLILSLLSSRRYHE